MIKNAGSRKLVLALALGAGMWRPAAAVEPDGTRPMPSPAPSGVARLEAIPRGFIPNVGQVPDAGTRFLLRDGGVTAHFTDDGFVLWTGQSATVTVDGRPSRVPVAPRWELVGANAVRPVGGETYPHTVSYFRGNDPARWQSRVPAYRDLRYPGILDGVELRIESREPGFEYTLHLAPHARPDLRFRYDGIEGLETSPAGDLIVRTPGGQFRESRPVAFQWINGVRHDVTSSFEVVSGREYRIVLGNYDRGHELVVDPVLDWSTSVGGSYGDQINAIKVGPFGEIVVAGVSHSVDLPTTPGLAGFGTDAGENFGSDPVWPEHSDVYLAKFSGDGTQLVWAAYLGGEGPHPESTGRNKPLAIDPTGDVYITTHTQSPDFPVFPAGSSTHQGGTDASVTRIASDGSALVWSRLMGAEAEDYGYAVAVHGNDLYLSGVTTSAGFPVTSRAFAGMQDAFVARLGAADGTVGWSTVLGGSGEERVSALVADEDGVILFGDTDSADFHAPDFPIPSGHDRTLGGGNDTFLTRLSASGAIVWSTYFGGSGAETTAMTPIQGFALTWGVSDMALDSGGNLVVAGHTYSPDLPGTAGRFQPTFVGPVDGYVAKLAPDGSQVLWCTYLGGTGVKDLVVGIALNPWDEPVVSGATTSPNFPTTADALKPSMTADGNQDGFLAKLSPDGRQLLYSTLVGLNGWHDGAVAVEYGDGKMFTGGWHYDTFSPVTQGAFQRNCNNCGHEMFLMSFLDAYLAHDGFESGTFSGGTGWAGNWVASGDASLQTTGGPHSGGRHARLRSGTGYLERIVNVPAGCLSIRLGFWAKVSSFEASDRADVLVRSTGAGFTPVAAFTAALSDDQYRYYEIDLTPFLPASQIRIAFDAGMSASNDNLYLDDLRVTGTTGSAPPVADAGPDQTVTDSDGSGTEAVILDGSASSDPDGGGVVAYEWREGETVLGTGAVLGVSLPVGVHTLTLMVTDDEGDTGTDTVQVTVLPYVAPVEVFYDSFEVGEWNGLWTEDSQNDWFLSAQRATQGTRSAEVDGGASDASLTSIPVNLQGRTSATITFDWFIESGLDTGEYLEFRVSTDGGSTWTQKAVLRGNVDPENSWRGVTVGLTGITQLRLQFRGRMSAGDEDANVDQVRVVAQ